MDAKELIKSYYPKEADKMGGLNNIKVYKIVYASNARAVVWFDDYFDKNKNNIEFYKRSLKNQLVIALKDGARIISVLPNKGARGYRYKSVVLDYKNISLDIFKDVILPCGYACSRDNVEFID